MTIAEKRGRSRQDPWFAGRAIIANMTEDEELREPGEPGQDEAQMAHATAAFAAFEEEWWREREERLAAIVDRAGVSTSRPCRKGAGVIECRA